jgi:hypothetical protein
MVLVQSAPVILQSWQGEGSAEASHGQNVCRHVAGPAARLGSGAGGSSTNCLSWNIGPRIVPV